MNPGAGASLVLAYCRTLAEVTFLTLLYWFVGLLPEEYHCRKGHAWARVGAYRWAAWHYRKHLKYSDDSFGRASLAWCYESLGLLEPAIQHYRAAYARNPRPDFGCYLAGAELAAGNVAGARALQSEIAKRRDELSPELASAFADLEAQLAGLKLSPSEVHGSRTGHDTAFDAANSRPRRTRPLWRALFSAYAAYGVSAFVLNARFMVAWPYYNTPAYFSSLLVFVLLAGAIFCCSLLVTHLPVMLLARARLGGRFTRSGAALAGAALAPASMALCLIAFFGPIRGATVGQWIAFFAGSPVEFLFWSLPFWIGGAVFAASYAAARAGGPNEAATAERDVGMNSVIDEHVLPAGAGQRSANATSVEGHSPNRDAIRLEGQVELVAGDLMLRIPLAAGGDRLAPLAKGIGQIDGDHLCVIIQPWLAEKLRIGAGSFVVVDNENGKFSITRSDLNDLPVL